MGDIRVTRDFFLWCMSVIYLCAFASLYHQIPGLYGDSGILPVRAVVPVDTEPKSLQEKAPDLPTLLWLAPAFGLKVATMMEFLALLGTVIAFIATVWSRFRDCANFALLYIIYFSLYQVGQTFLWFQWDILLLEAGFLCILVAPLGLLHRSLGLSSSWGLPHHMHDTVTFWLVRWLLFRLMFASGVVKLTSMCPTWWSLSALYYHFESQCIPTPVAWFAHHLPAWVLRLGVVSTYVTEIAIPFLFFVPVRSLKIFCFYSQVIFQLAIILTGNYNFFNILTIVLCLSLVDDDFLLNALGRPVVHTKYTLRITRYLISRSISLVVYGGLIYWSVKLFNLKFLHNWILDSKIGFTPEAFHSTLNKTLPITMCIGALSLGANILLSFHRSIFNVRGLLSQTFSVAGTVIWGCVAVWIFCISLMPFTVIDQPTHKSIWPVVKQWHHSVDRFGIVNSYGLFRRMTGVDGRPELVIQGSDFSDSGWKEYHFFFKPGNLSDSPSFLMPHQPRLDWQMWFAALGSYKQNPWFVSFVYRLLTGQQEVLNLIDKDNSPFPTRPPKYIRAILYKYRYTSLEPGQRKPFVNDWWVRDEGTEYLPPIHKEHPFLKEYLKTAKIPTDTPRLRSTSAFLKPILFKARQFANSLHPRTFVWSIVSSSLVVNFIALLLGV